MPVPDRVFKQIQRIIPPLNGKLHKGQSGRVGVLGGALDYTGAPYFAAISSQRLGAELGHVICSPTAAAAIKGYSPDLIVHPILKEEIPPEKLRHELSSLLERLHVLVVGPGLGREDYMQSFARLAVTIAKEQRMYLVLDADALWMVGRDIDIIKGYKKAVLTPNVMEFKRLSEAVGIDPSSPPSERASLLSKSLGGVTILQKGPIDIISTNTSTTEGANDEVETFEVDVEGGLKRCGGQGDILSGTVGAFLAWGKCYETGAYGDKTVPSERIPILASVGGSMVTRTTSRIAYRRKGRSLVTQDILGEIGHAFQEVFENEYQDAEVEQSKF